jgi:hypothetical protein
MPTPTATSIRKSQDWLLRTARDSQKAVADTVSIWSSVVEQAAPVTKKISLTKQIPSATSIVGPTFDFAEKLLEAQRQFVSNVVDAALPARAKPATKTSKVASA